MARGSGRVGEQPITDMPNVEGAFRNKVWFGNRKGVLGVFFRG